MNKINFVLNFLESTVGRRLIGGISDETFYTLLLNALSLVKVNDEWIKIIIKILEESKTSESWGKLITDPEIISSIRELLVDFKSIDDQSDVVIERL